MRPTLLHSPNGFTLMEIIIIVSIIGLIAIISLPLYTGQREQASDSIAETTTRQAIEYAQMRYQLKGYFPDFTDSTILTKAGTDTGFTWVSWDGAGGANHGESTGNKEPSVITRNTQQAIEICTLSTPGSDDYMCAMKDNNVSDPAANPELVQTFCRRPTDQLGGPQTECQPW